MEQEIQLNKQECLPTCTTDFNPTLNDIIIYQTEDGEIKLDVKMDKETVWLTQAQMSDLFQTDRTAILRHINNIYKSQELESESTCAKIAQVRTEGKRNVTRYIPYYNLDMIISLGYRIKSVNRKLLTGAGSVSHKQALEKAKSEYRKYQEITLTPVEKVYLESIKEVSKEVKRR